MIAFIFVTKDTTIEPVVEIAPNFITSNLVIIENELSDFFNLRNNETLAKNTFTILENKSSNYFINKLVDFRSNYLKKEDNTVIIKSVDKLKTEWIKRFPRYGKYKDLGAKITSKLGMLVEILSEVNE